MVTDDLDSCYSYIAKINISSVWGIVITPEVLCTIVHFLLRFANNFILYLQSTSDGTSSGLDDQLDLGTFENLDESDDS